MRFSRAKKREYVVISVGGSLLVPDAIDTLFLERFRAFILDQVGRGVSFYIVTGGGMTARSYQRAAEAVRGGLDPEDVDWIGIHATRLNAHLLRALFKEHAQAKIIKNPEHRMRANSPIVIGAGWRPGRSTDYCAVMAGKSLGAKKIINLSNIEYVYDLDPKVHPEAVPKPMIGWAEFRTLIPDTWDPGLSSPFDPVAARAAESLGMEVAIIHGNRLDDVAAFIAGSPFTGTLIS